MQQLSQFSALLTPPFPVVAPDIGALHNMIPGFAYVLYFHLMEMPTGVIPFGLVNSDEANYKQVEKD